MKRYLLLAICIFSIGTPSFLFAQNEEYPENASSIFSSFEEMFGFKKKRDPQEILEEVRRGREEEKASQQRPTEPLSFGEYVEYQKNRRLNPPQQRETRFDKLANSSDGEKIYGETNSYREHEDNNGIDKNQLYRNEEYGFRIKFPDGWDVQEGEEDVLKRSIKDNSTISILASRAYLSEMMTQEEINSISQKELENFGMNSDFTDEEVVDFFQDLSQGLLESFPGSSIIESDVRHVNGQKMAYILIDQHYNVLGNKIEGISINYFTIHRGTFFHIGGFYPLDPVDESDKKLAIETSLETFAFDKEVSNESSEDALKNSIWKGDTEITSNILLWSFFFTWILGLTPAIVVRFIRKKPTARWLSIIISLFVYSVLAMTSLAMGNTTISLALILVALISYWILTRESVRYRYCPYCKKVIKREVLFCKKCGKEV